MQTSLTLGNKTARYGSQTTSSPNTPSDSGTSITVSDGAPPLPERRSTSRVWCSTLATALKAGASKATTAMPTATLGALAGLGVKALAVSAIGTLGPVLGPATVIVGGGVALAYGGSKAGDRAKEMMSARSDASLGGTGNGLSKCVDYTLRLAPVVIPLGRALIAGLVTGSPMVAASCIGASLAGMVCSGVRDTLTAPLRNVLPGSKLVDAQGGAMSEAQEIAHQTGSTVLATLLDGGLAVGGNSGLAPSMQGIVAPFDSASEIIVYGALRGGFAMIQEVSKAIVALGLGGRLDTMEGGGGKALRDNLFDEKGRQATLDSIRDNCAMRLVVNSFAVETMTGLEDAIPGGQDPLGPTRVFTSLALGAGESRSTLVEQGRAGETKLGQIVDRVENIELEPGDLSRPSSPTPDLDCIDESPAPAENRGKAEK